MLRVLVVLALTLGAGCGPIEYVTTVTFQATHALSQAKRSHADTLAIYEYTLAVEKLHKARELAGHARWQQALRFGQSALDTAHKAEVIAAEKTAHPDEKVE